MTWFVFGYRLDPVLMFCSPPISSHRLFKSSEWFRDVWFFICMSVCLVLLNRVQFIQSSVQNFPWIPHQSQNHCVEKMMRLYWEVLFMLGSPFLFLFLVLFFFWAWKVFLGSHLGSNNFQAWVCLFVWTPVLITTTTSRDLSMESILRLSPRQ